MENFLEQLDTSLRFGSTIVEADGQLVTIRMGIGNLTVTNVSDMEKDEKGTMTIMAGGDTLVTITKGGDVSFSYYSAPKEMREIRARKKRESDFLQEEINLGKEEIDSFELEGIVEAAPYQLKTARSPLAFIVKEIETDIRHEVWATGRAKEQVKPLKLTKGAKVKGQFVKLVYEVDLSNGEKKTHERLNLLRVIAVETRRKRA